MGFLGPNGAGKTTTMRSVLGLVSIDQGTVEWNGRPMGPENRRSIGYMPQERGLYPRMRVLEQISYIGRLAGLDDDVAERRAHHWAERVGLADRGDDLIQELSTGNQQRVQLAVALVHEPALLVLDEPFAGLDPVAVSTMCEVMVEQVEQGASVVFSSHQLDLVQDLAEHVTIIAAGTTQATGTVTELRQSAPERILEIVWDDEVPHWSPEGATRREAPARTSRFVVDASVDAAALVSDAGTAGRMASFSFEPPTLDEIFREVVA